MKSLKFMLKSAAVAVSSLVLVVACGGSGGSGGMGSLTLGITDAAVDEAESVVVEFTGVEIQPSEGDRISIDYVDARGDSAPKQIDLLNLQGGIRDLLLDGQVLPAGSYQWIRLKVNAESDAIYDSYITIDGVQYELLVPSGSQSGLKLNRPFSIDADAAIDLTIDFDLRKSVNLPKGRTNPSGIPLYRLKPVLRLVETPAAGSIGGTVDSGLFAGHNCDSDPLNGYAVYLFEGGGVTPDDIDGLEADPLTTAKVSLNADSEYEYRLAYIPPGSYTIAATCSGNLDDAEENDDANVLFAGRADLTISPGQQIVHDFM